MEANSSSSWADQWDYNPEPAPAASTQPKKGGGGGVKAKVGEGLGKTKAVASIGMKKVKHGTTAGLHWIKDKYHKTTVKR